MKPKKRQKLCHHCEGEVDLDVIVCPFCAADLREEKPEQQRSVFNPGVSSLKQLHTEQSLYPSSYNRICEEQPYSPEQLSAQPQEQILPTVSTEREAEESTPLKSTLLGISLFTLGSHCFLLTLLMFFFSDRGTLLLQWNAALWPFYFIASLPLLLFGYRLLKNL